MATMNRERPRPDYFGIPLVDPDRTPDNEHFNAKFYEVACFFPL